MNSQLLQTPAAQAWQRIGIKHHHGCALLLSALHSERSCGIGEYLDLLPLIDWCQQVGLDVIQLLPLNDTGLEMSPYSALSAFALNPVYISLYALPHLDRIINITDKLRRIAYWTQTSRVKYHIVRELKTIFFKEYVPLVLPALSETEGYQTFVKENQAWLQPYALFKALKEAQYWRSWEEWPSDCRTPDPYQYAELCQTHRDAIAYHQLIQYLCYEQLSSVKQHAHEQGIWLKGDIPILINRESADVWYDRHLFSLHLSAGSPPDQYSTEGQNWNFPIYDWATMHQEQDIWWKRRLQVATSFYHLYRIDHIVGFFRIWAIAGQHSAKEGSFVPANEQEWIPAGEKVMRMMLAASPLLPIGEDLGCVPLSVRACLTSLGICGTKVMRWERRYETDGGFISPSEYPAISMTTVSTHDSDTLQLWWKHSPKEAHLYSEFQGWDYRPFLTAERQFSILRSSHHSASLFHINLLQEYLALFPALISEHVSDERINIPGKVLDTNWTYRFKPSIETLVKHEGLANAIKEIIKGVN